MKGYILSLAISMLLGAMLVVSIIPLGRIPQDLNHSTTNRLLVDELTGFNIPTLEAGDISVDLMVAGNQIVGQ